ncbi:MAG: quinolinate synthase NadA [Bacteroidia bacterium]|nr:quinolinate synthase NadA [Bacteroidia bacterium]
MIDVNSLSEKGFLDISIDKNINLTDEINKLRKEKKAIILAHYYQKGEIQDIADFVGDSLQLSQQASQTDAKIIVFTGVHFMAETAKILSPGKKVILPDLKAGCSLAESAPVAQFREFLRNYPEHIVITYINTSAAIKALSDICCTSSNAVKIVNSFPGEQKIIFAPDKNLGNYINCLTGRNMVLWNGACHVHEEFSLEKILELKAQYQEAKIIAHPECKKPVRIVADYIGSTAALLNYTKQDNCSTYIIATESGIIHQMKKANPDKIFIPAPPKDSTCGCSDCNYMKLNTLEKLYICLKYELPEIILDEDIRKKAEVPIKRMLEL